MGRRADEMEVRFHGRGGQGVVTAAELLSMAAFTDGRFAQAFPSFGSERMGAPVAAYCRMADQPIRTRQPVVEPDGVVVGDVTLLHHVDVLGGLAPGGWVVLDAERAPAPGQVAAVAAVLPVAATWHWAAVPATEVGRRLVGRPVPNAALLGAVAALCPSVSLASVQEALRQRFPGALGEGNAAAAAAGYDQASRELQEAAGAGPA